MDLSFLTLTAAGVVACFFGRRLFAVALALLGMSLGLGLVSAGASLLETLIVGALGALAGLVAAFLVFYAAVFCLGAAAGWTVALWLWREGVVHLDLTLLRVILVIVGGLTALWLHRHAIIVLTAATGAWFLVLGVSGLAGHPLGASTHLHGTVLLGWMALAVAGMIHQYRGGSHLGRLSADACGQRAGAFG